MPEPEESTHDAAVRKLKDTFASRRRLIGLALDEAGVRWAVVLDEHVSRWLGLAPGSWAVHDGEFVVAPDAVREVVLAGGRGVTVGLQYGPDLRAVADMGLLDRGRCVDITAALRGVRLVKDRLDLSLLSRAASMTETALDSVTEAVDAVPSYELAHRLEQALWAQGWEGTWAFDPSVGSGRQLAADWTAPSAHRIEPGDLVSADVGIRFKGMCSDVTRTWHLGRTRLGEEELRALDAVQSVMSAMPAALVPGRPCSDVAHELLDALGSRGWRTPTDIALGHGIGLQVHEPPTIGPSSSEVLLADMVVCVEPCVVLEDQTRVRLEGMFHVGAESSTPLGQGTL